MSSIFTDGRFYSLLVLIGIALGIGTLFYSQVEGLSWIDAFYFSGLTLTTVGYGDITPQTDVGKIFAVIYTFFGLGIVLTLFKIVADHAFVFSNVKNILDHIHKKREIKKEVHEEVDKEVKKEVKKKMSKL